jgi:hypothetical protein
MFLSFGVGEANPLVRFAMFRTNPFLGLLLMKLAAIALAIYCTRTGRSLFKVNLFFMFLLVWNITAMILTK